MKNYRFNYSLIFLFVLISIASFSQDVKVYKTNDLLKRIYNKSDTLYIVNFWATWCKPCVAELPDFEKINTEIKNRPVKVLLVCMDFKEDISKKVIPFLTKHQYKTEVVLLDEINGNDFINQISKQWSGAIPATIITKKNRKRFEFYEKKLSYDFLKSTLNKY